MLSDSFALSESGDHFILLGGNRHDEVTRALYQKAHWFPSLSLPIIIKGRAVALRTVAMILLVLCSVTSYAVDIHEAQTYWSRFRRAVLDHENEKIASMTKFPLWVRGTVDGDPVIYYSRKDFNLILKLLLNQQVVASDGDAAEIKTMLQVIKDKKQLTSRDFRTPNLVRVELFRFDKIKGTWLLTRGYLEE